MFRDLRKKSEDISDTSVVQSVRYDRKEALRRAFSAKVVEESGLDGTWEYQYNNFTKFLKAGYDKLNAKCLREGIER
jgi:hypothetical protein